MHLTLERHRSEQRRSTYTGIFFNKYKSVFSFYGSLTVGKSLCSIRDHNVWTEKNKGLNPDFIQTVSASCPRVNNLLILLFLRQRKQYVDFWLCRVLVPLTRPHYSRGSCKPESMLKGDKYSRSKIEQSEGYWKLLWDIEWWVESF